MPTHLLPAEAVKVSGELSSPPTHSPSAGEAEALVSRAIAHPPCCTPAGDTAPGDQLAQLNLALARGMFYICYFASGGAHLRKGRRWMLYSLCISRRNTYDYIYFMARKWSVDIP